jgi:hypothetical protein
VWLVYETAQAQSKAAELFANKRGRLSSLFSKPVSAAFPEVSGGEATCPFDRLSLIDSSIARGEVRIRILDTQGSTLATRVFTGTNTNATFDNTGGGSFSADGRYACLFYRLPSVSSTQDGDNVLQVLHTKTLEPVAKFTYPGSNNEPYFFSVPDQRKYYIALAWANVAVAIINGEPTVQAGCPSVLQILRFVPQCSKLMAVAKAQLPGFAVGRMVLSACRADAPPLIAMATVAAVGSKQVNPFTIPTPSCTGQDDAEIRVYSFNGRCLSLIASQSTYSRSGGIAFSPAGDFLAFALRSFNAQTPADCAAEYGATLEIAQLEQNNGSLSPILIRGALPPVSLNVRWSENGKWLLVSGSPSPDQPTKTIQLFRVIQARSRRVSKT